MREWGSRAGVYQIRLAAQEKSTKLDRLMFTRGPIIEKDRAGMLRAGSPPGSSVTGMGPMSKSGA